MADTLRILQLHNHHAAKGGAMEVLDHERQLLLAAGHEVEQLTLPATDELDLSPLRQGAKAVWNKEFAIATVAAIRRFRPDIAHVHTPFPLMSPAVFRATHACGVPTVATVHSFRLACVAATCVRDDAICEDCVGKRVKWPAVVHRCYHGSTLGSAALAGSLTLHHAIGTFTHSVDCYLTLTDFARRLLERDGFPADKIVVKPNSVPDPGVGRGPDPAAPRYLLFAGRLIEIKGIRTLLEAWQRADVGELRLVVAGDGELRPLVEATAAADRSIDFRGWIAESDVTDLMAGALATVVPSQWYEGLPLVILRSLSVGTPVLVSDLENISAELLEDGAGRSFAVGDVGALGGLLADVAGNPVLLHQLRGKARASFSARYSPAVDLKRLTDVYRSLAGR